MKSLSESGFLVTESRARRFDISHDIYAHLWTTESTHVLWEEFSKKVYPYDDIELSLRNRFFLDTLNTFIHSTINPIFINIGAGFTSYPFLIKKPCKCIEVDLPNVIDFKKHNIQSFINEKKLPKKDIEFIAADLSKKEDMHYLHQELKTRINNHTSCIFLEGITYYLESIVLEKILEMCSIIQIKNSVLVFDYWDPTIVTNPVFNRFVSYFNERFGHKKNQYHLLDNDFITSIKGYRIEEKTDIQQLEKKYLKTALLKDSEKIIPENYIILKRSL